MSLLGGRTKQHKESFALAKGYLEVRFEQIEDGDVKAELLSEVVTEEEDAVVGSNGSDQSSSGCTLDTSRTQRGSRRPLQRKFRGVRHGEAVTVNEQCEWLVLKDLLKYGAEFQEERARVKASGGQREGPHRKMRV